MITVFVLVEDTAVDAMLVPAGATIVSDGSRVAWEGDGIDAREGTRLAFGPDGAGIGWTVAEDEWSPPASDPEPAIDLYAYAANKRWRIETGGITVAGMAVATDRESQGLINGAYTYARDTPGVQISFKSPSGFVTMESETAIMVGRAVAEHVQACFAAESAVSTAIATGSFTTVEHIESWPWPDNAYVGE